MKGFLHHLGDWATATAHLSLLERGAYHALIEAYYTRGEALPADTKKCDRLVNARTPREIEAVARVLDEFFTLESDGLLHQKRCDEEIAKARDRIAQQTELANRRWQGHNAKRNTAELLSRSELLVTPDMSKKSAHAREPQRTLTNVDEPTKNANGSAMAHALAMPTNYLNTSSNKTTTNVAVVAALAGVSSSRGFKANPDDPRTLDLIAAGATVDDFARAADMAVALGKPWGYAVGIVANWQAEGRHAPSSSSPNYPMLPRAGDPW